MPVRFASESTAQTAADAFCTISTRTYGQQQNELRKSLGRHQRVMVNEHITIASLGRREFELEPRDAFVTWPRFAFRDLPAHGSIRRALGGAKTRLECARELAHSANVCRSHNLTLFRTVHVTNSVCAHFDRREPFSLESGVVRTQIRCCMSFLIAESADVVCVCASEAAQHFSSWPQRLEAAAMCVCGLERAARLARTRGCALERFYRRTACKLVQARSHRKYQTVVGHVSVLLFEQRCSNCSTRQPPLSTIRRSSEHQHRLELMCVA